MGLSADNVLRPVVLFLVFCLDDKYSKGHQRVWTSGSNF